jgi:hypothetical protein
MDIETVTHESFESCLGETFRVDRGDEAQVIDLELTHVDVRGQPEAVGEGEPARQGFSLMFTGPGDEVLTQGIFRLEHAFLGSADLFLVPLGLHGELMRYEIVVS